MSFSHSFLVGHCHPEIVAVGRKVLSHFLTMTPTERREPSGRQQKKLCRARRDSEDDGNAKDISLLLDGLLQQLRAKLPDHYDTFYFTKSGLVTVLIANYSIFS
jgi:hypothetical protein